MKKLIAILTLFVMMTSCNEKVNYAENNKKAIEWIYKQNQHIEFNMYELDTRGFGYEKVKYLLKVGNEEVYDTGWVTIDVERSIERHNESIKVK